MADRKKDYYNYVIEVIKLLCVHDHMINAQDNAGYTPLHCACRLDHTDIVKTLMLVGADETIKDIDWRTPAQLAKSKGHKELLTLLDRVTLWEKMQTNNFHKMSVSFQVVLTLQLMRLKLMKKKWCHLLAVVHVAFTINKYFHHKHRKIKKTKHKCILLIA